MRCLRYAPPRGRPAIFCPASGTAPSPGNAVTRMEHLGARINTCFPGVAARPGSAWCMQQLARMGLYGTNPPGRPRCAVAGRHAIAGRRLRIVPRPRSGAPWACSHQRPGDRRHCAARGSRRSYVTAAERCRFWPIFSVCLPGNGPQPRTPTLPGGFCSTAWPAMLTSSTLPASSRRCIRATTPSPVRSSCTWPPTRSTGAAPTAATRYRWRGSGTASCRKPPSAAGKQEVPVRRAGRGSPSWRDRTRPARGGCLVADRRLLALRAVRNRRLHPRRRQPGRCVRAPGMPATRPAPGPAA